MGRALNDARDITHNLRTAVIDAEGKVVKVYTGNEWSPDLLLKDLRSEVSRVKSQVSSIKAAAPSGLES